MVITTLSILAHVTFMNQKYLIYSSDLHNSDGGVVRKTEKLNDIKCQYIERIINYLAHFFHHQQYEQKLDRGNRIAVLHAQFDFRKFPFGLAIFCDTLHMKQGLQGLQAGAVIAAEAFTLHSRELNAPIMNQPKEI